MGIFTEPATGDWQREPRKKRCYEKSGTRKRE